MAMQLLRSCGMSCTAADDGGALPLHLAAAAGFAGVIQVRASTRAKKYVCVVNVCI